MDNLHKIAALGLFVLLVVIIIFTRADIQSTDVVTDPGVPLEQIDPPALDLDTGPEDVQSEDSEVVESVACTMDAKLCPDGSAVGRTGPNCEFAACPVPESIVCTDEQKQAKACTREYAPVCGLVQIQCITTPCDPIPETFGNACSACAQGNVLSYTQGECSI